MDGLTMHTSGLNRIELVQENVFLNILLNITKAIRENKPLEIVLKNCLSIICINLHYPVGHIYFFDEENNILTPSDIWFIKDTHKTSHLYTLTMKTTLGYCEGIGGLVLASGEACLIADLRQNEHFSRKEACLSDSIHSAMAFPVYLDEKLIFVVEFFTHTYQKNDNSLLFLLNRLSVHMSHSMLERNHIDELNKRISQLRFALGSGKVGVWEYNPRTQEVIWDEQMYLMYGIVPHDFSGTYSSWEEVLHPDDRERTANEFKETLFKKHNFDTDFRIITPAGNTRYIRANAMVKRSIDGVAESIFGINVDITKEKTLLLDLFKKTKELGSVDISFLA